MPSQNNLLCLGNASYGRPLSSGTGFHPEIARRVKRAALKRLSAGFYTPVNWRFLHSAGEASADPGMFGRAVLGHRGSDL